MSTQSEVNDGDGCLAAALTILGCGVLLIVAVPVLFGLAWRLFVWAAGV
jgi:hypothetical protein